MMSTKKYRIRLTTDEQQELNALVSRGRAAAYQVDPIIRTAVRLK